MIRSSGTILQVDLQNPIENPIKPSADPPPLARRYRLVVISFIGKPQEPLLIK